MKSLECMKVCVFFLGKIGGASIFLFATSALAMSDVTGAQSNVTPKPPISETPIAEKQAGVTSGETKETVSLCAGVFCSHHGTCVVKNNEPLCACEAGYFPDQLTGTHCKARPELKLQPLGFAKEAAIGGFISTAILLGVGIPVVSMAPEENAEESPGVRAVGGISTMALLAMGQIVSFGAYTARSEAAPGVYGMLVTARVLYTMGLTLGTLWTILGERQLGYYFEAAAGLSLLFYSIDAMVVHVQASEVRNRQTGKYTTWKVTPSVTLLQSYDSGVSGVVASLSGEF